MSRDGSQIDRPTASDATSAIVTTEEAFLRQIAGGGSGPPTDASSHPPAGGDWAGPRFAIARRLGIGGFGAVYEVFDHQHQARVALKTVTRQDTSALYQFKREFRSLADLVHPNLVELYELHGDDTRWFFTMELVRGVDLKTALDSVDAAGVRAALAQLAEGLCFLHEAGRLHRDIKPSNVMVDADGRVVLLDFGLVVDVADADSARFGAAGTPRYMAPEMFTGPIGPAADWYAVGVLLYERLAGQPPFEGTFTELARLKSTRDPPPLAELAAKAPADLRRLCHDLLRRDPRARPGGREVLARLAGHASDRSGLRDVNAAAAAFVGRTAELERLHAAFACARAGRTTVAFVHGAPGLGKTTLVARYLADLRGRTPDAIVLTGRCFEQESVPYQALDSLVDDLGRYLAWLPSGVREALTPRDIATLLTLFPSLAQALRGARRAVAIADKVEARRRAVLALGELLTGLAARAPVVLWIDDLHWGDRDGGALLTELLARADAPPLLLLLGFRSDEAERSECLQRVLPPLAEADARRLVAHMLDALSPGATDHADALARESRGSPLVARELCHYFHDPSAAATTPVSTFGAMLTARVAALPEDARRLLEVVALAGQRIERGVVGAASRIGDREPAVVGLLRRGSFVRTSSGRAGEEVEAAHDRVREVVVAGLAPDARVRHHRDLARALAATGRAEPELLASHLDGAGERAEAAGHWEQAAEQAFHALALARAERLYRQALATRVAAAPEPSAVRRLRARLGETLALTGRGAEAATAYLAAASDAEPTVATDMRRLALEQYLWSGHVDEGFGVLGSVLAATRLTMPRTRLGVAVGVLGRLLRLRLRGVRRRPSAAVDTPAGLARLDVATAASASLGMLDPPRAFYFHLGALELALRSRDSFRLLRVLLMEQVLRAVSRAARPPTRGDEEVERLIRTVHAELAPGDPWLTALDGSFAFALGLRHLFRGEPAAACAELARAEARLQDSPLQLGNVLGMTRAWLATVLWIVGAWRRLREHVTRGLSDAHLRGDRFGALQLRQWDMIFALFADRADDAAAAHERWVADVPRSARVGDLTARPTLALYRGAGVGDEARRLLDAAWTVEYAILARLSLLMGAATYFARGGACLAAAAVADAPARLLRRVEREARTLARLRTPYAAPFAVALRAGAAAGAGARGRAEALLVEAEAGFVRLGMAMHVAAVRRRRGELVGGAAGAELVADADRVVAAEGVRSPERMLGTVLPGRWQKI